MANDIFQYRDYKRYLRDWIASQPRRGRGIRTQLAEKIQCNTTYVAQVLNGRPHFSQEQAEAASHFMGLRFQERVFFLLLLQRARAGTPSLRAFLERQIEEHLRQQLDLKTRLEYKKVLTVEDQLTYYSAWYFSAIHVVLSIPALQTRDAIAKYFGLSSRLVSEALNFLVTTGLAVEHAGRFQGGPVSIHLPKDSPAIAKHHSNWRSQAVEAVHQRRPSDVHYSSVIAMSSGDEARVRAILVKAIEEVRSVVRDSKEDAAYCYCLDFFPLAKEQ